MVCPYESASIGAFMMEGLRDLELLEGTPYLEIIDTWGGGCVELVEYMTGFAPYLLSLCKEYEAKGYEFPGVFNYEVSAAFGTWFGKEVHGSTSGDLPSHEMCQNKCEELVREFFEQVERVE